MKFYNLTRQGMILPFAYFAAMSCSTLRESPKYQLGDGVYEYRQRGATYQKVNVYVDEDTIGLTSFSNGEKITPGANTDLFFLKRSFDVDIMTVGFKYRPASLNLPRQLNTDFNGNVFLGYRYDRFKVRYKKTPLGLKQTNHHRGITSGVFAGVGATAMTPWTTNNLITDEYSGLVLTRGVAVMMGLNNLTVGVGIGWDSITDRDKDIWIYQNKPWYGLTIGLNLN
jgi:hypothetical protein